MKFPAQIGQGIFIDKVITLGTPNHGTWIGNPLNPWAIAQMMILAFGLSAIALALLKLTYRDD